MARQRSKGPEATIMARDDGSEAMPIMPWGTVHNLSPTESTADINSAAISDACGVVSIIAIGGGAHFALGDSTVVATTSNAYLPEGIWHELPISKGDDYSYVSVISATGAGDIVAQIVERQ